MKRTFALTAATVAALAIAGCGSSDDEPATTTSTGDQAAETRPAGGSGEAAAEIERLTARPTSIGIDAPLDAPPAAGKQIAYLDCGVPACVALGKSLEAAAEQVGWKVRNIPQGLTPESVKAAWSQVARFTPDGVVATGGFPTQIFAAELAELHAAGGAMVSVADVAAPQPDKGFIAAVAGADRAQAAGRRMADWAVAQTGGKGTIQMIDASGFPSVAMQSEAFSARLKETCPDCTVKTFDAPLSSFGKTLPAQIAQQLRKNPEASALVLGSGDMAVGLPTALADAGISDPPPAITQGQTPEIAQVLKSGGLAAIYGQEVNEVMWRAVDALLRHFGKQSLTPNAAGDVAAEWLVTADNLPTTTEPFPLVEDYQAQYRKLWGLE